MVSQEGSLLMVFYSLYSTAQNYRSEEASPSLSPSPGLRGTETEGSTHPRQELLGMCAWRGRRDTGVWAPGLPTQTPIISLLRARVGGVASGKGISRGGGCCFRQGPLIPGSLKESGD